MTVATFKQPNVTSDTPAEYKNNIDASIKALMELAANFAPHEAAIPDMTVVVDAGKLWTGASYITAAQQTTAAFTAPTTNPRIDRIAIDKATGSYVVIAGTEAVTPVAPNYSTNHYPVCQFQLATSTTAITNSMLTDERALVQGGGPDVPGYVKSTIEYVPAEAPNYSANRFNVTGTVPVSAWKSVGPTTSGADYIWTDLDSLPAGIVWVDLYFLMQPVVIPAGNTLAYIFARKTGSLAAVDYSTECLRAYLRIDTTPTASHRYEASITRRVPVNASGQFDIQWVLAFGSSVTGYMSLAGAGA